jgi:hypothetical protein
MSLEPEYVRAVNFILEGDMAGDKVLRQGRFNQYKLISTAVSILPDDKLYRFIDRLIDYGFMDFNYIVKNTVFRTRRYYDRYHQIRSYLQRHLLDRD